MYKKSLYLIEYLYNSQKILKIVLQHSTIISNEEYIRTTAEVFCRISDKIFFQIFFGEFVLLGDIFFEYVVEKVRKYYGKGTRKFGKNKATSDQIIFNSYNYFGMWCRDSTCIHVYDVNAV